MRARASWLIALLLACGCQKRTGEDMVVRKAARFAPARYSPASTERTKEAEAVRPANAPTIAYSYTYGFEMPSGNIAAGQERARTRCDAQGPTRCQVVAIGTRVDDPGGGATSLSLKVDARIAAAFGRQVAADTVALGGRSVDEDVEGEDLSKQIVDLGARLRAKQALTDRLLAIIRSGKGSVGDLVAAEKAYAQNQEEMDAARGELAMATGRVATTDMQFEWHAPDGGGIFRPVAAALRGVGETLGTSLGALVITLAALLPWLVILAPGLWLIRRGLRAWRARRRRAT